MLLNNHLKLWDSIDQKYKKKLILLFFVMLLSSISEIFSIIILMPFLTMITSVENFYNLTVTKKIIEIFNIKDDQRIISIFTIIFIACILISGFMRLILIYLQAKISHEIGANLCQKIFTKMIKLNYLDFKKFNSGEFISSLTLKVNTLVSSVILPIINIVTSIFIAFAILISVAYVDFQISLYSFLSFGMIYFLIILYTKRKLFFHSQVLSVDQVKITKIIQEAFYGFKDIVINNLHNYFFNIFKSTDLKIRNSIVMVYVIGQSPRYVIESIGISLIALFSMLLMNDSENSFVNYIPTIGVLVLAAQRILPLFQQVYSGLISIKSGNHILIDIINLTNQKYSYETTENIKEIKFDKQIELSNVSFKYPGSNKWIFKNYNLKINKFEFIKLSSKSGKGKTTLIDIIINLIKPLEGDLYIDEKKIDSSYSSSWHQKISHVPQEAFFSDSSIISNIAFGIHDSQINQYKIEKIIKICELDEIIKNLPNGIETIIGERGLTLSGGQRQKIALARSLYRESEILILDEATNAIDIDSENRILNNLIENYNMTIIFITHRQNKFTFPHRTLNLE